MFMIVNSKTKKPLRISYTMETKGRDYMSTEVPQFDLENEDVYNQDYPVFVTPSKKVAEEILEQKFTGVDDIKTPYFYKGWDSNGDPLVYEIVEIKL